MLKGNLFKINKCKIDNKILDKIVIKLMQRII